VPLERAERDAEAISALPAPGHSLLEAVDVMDRLRSPGGCPWDAAQTHESLVRYLVEECYELVQALEDGDVEAMREELGDVLLQVLFHARIAAETVREHGGFDIDDIAEDLVAKLVRRHPHVFGPNADPGLTAEDQQARWDELKKIEKAQPSVVDGVALGQPALALAAKLGARSAKYGADVPLPAGDSPAEQIYRLAFEAGVRGDDPESGVRTLARRSFDYMARATDIG
jgi:XTP/dITP diphosphohydrolase